MMNNFTPRAQQVLALARKEAERFNHNYVGTEHLLLGLIKLGEGVAVNVLQKMALDLEIVRKEVEKHVGPRPETKMIGNIPYTPRVKKVLALAGKEAQASDSQGRSANRRRSSADFEGLTPEVRGTPQSQAYRRGAGSSRSAFRSIYYWPFPAG